MLTITATDAWRQAHPGGTIGLLQLSGIDNSQPAPALETQKRIIETALRTQYGDFTRADFLELPVLAAYKDYYRRFGKTYHVQLQLESIALKGKPLPAVSPLVDANFGAEVETFILAAGHDVAQLEGPVEMDVSGETDSMIQMNGRDKLLPSGDMIMRDAAGVCCSIIYGQDNRSPITPATTDVLYVAYGPAGVSRDAVDHHLRRIQAHVQLFAPNAVIEQHTLISA
ncbi:MAG: hypothetical protein KDE59_22265 [Anaerolineales bacterium]|nr:hypothetical protein [Anaerolineales bacterium]